jgi:hypothetical protein
VQLRGKRVLTCAAAYDAEVMTSCGRTDATIRRQPVAQTPNADVANPGSRSHRVLETDIDALLKSLEGTVPAVASSRGLHCSR